MAEVLIVEDNKELSDLLELILLQNNISVKIVHDAYVAIDYLDHHHVDLIITDFHMPRMDGVQLKQELVQRSIAPCTPVVLMTGSCEEHKGFDGYLRKPFPPEQFVGMVRRMILPSRCWPIDDYRELERQSA